MRTLQTIVLLVVALVCADRSCFAANEPQIQKGAVISASGDQLVIKDSAGKEQTHLVSRDTKITINGRMGRLDELKMSMLVRVTTDGGSKVVAVATVDDDKRLLLTAN